MNNGYINRTICVAAANPSERNSFKSHLVSPFLSSLIPSLPSSLFSLSLSLSSSILSRFFSFSLSPFFPRPRRLSSPPFRSWQSRKGKKKKIIRSAPRRAFRKSRTRATLEFLPKRSLLARSLAPRFPQLQILLTRDDHSG